MTNLDKKQKGMSILEVMVSLLVLAAGILGVTNLQTSSLQNATKSISRTQAAYLAYEILDRMRANPAEVYSVATGALPEPKNCFTQDCSTAELMNFDIAEWKCSFSSFQENEKCAVFKATDLSTVNSNSVYLNGDGSVSCQPVGSEKQCQVTVQWQENVIGSDTPVTQDFSMVVVM